MQISAITLVNVMISYRAMNPSGNSRWPPPPSWMSDHVQSNPRNDFYSKESCKLVLLYLQMMISYDD